jgi:DcuC family C4-dicarboxylate transporter
MVLAIGLLTLIVAGFAVARKYEVRWVLIASALLIATISGVQDSIVKHDLTFLISAWMRIVRVFVSTLSNEKFVVPICTAMGFAYVLRQTECDQHLIRLLIRPFRRVRTLLVSATVLIGFLVNIPLVSQTSTAVAVGTVLVPLLRASGVPTVTIASALALGTSLGGELLNPAAPELLSVARILQRDLPEATSRDCVVQVHQLIWWHLAVVTGVFWFCSWRSERGLATSSDLIVALQTAQAIRWDKALIPFVPLLVLFLTSPATGIIEVPVDWLTGPKDRETFDSRLIGAAMIFGSSIAALTMPRALGQSTAAFFEGTGYGLTHIIGLIVAASCFGEGIKFLGVHILIGELVERAPAALIPLAIFVPMLFALLSGSGMAATQSLFEFYVPAIEVTGADPFRVGAFVSIGAAAGRTMSPVAAVVLMSTRMANAEPLQVTRRLVGPLVTGLLALILVAWLTGR